MKLLSFAFPLSLNRCSYVFLLIVYKLLNLSNYQIFDKKCHYQIFLNVFFIIYKPKLIFFYKLNLLFPLLPIKKSKDHFGVTFYTNRCHIGQFVFQQFNGILTQFRYRLIGNNTSFYILYKNIHFPVQIVQK